MSANKIETSFQLNLCPDRHEHFLRLTQLYRFKQITCFVDGEMSINGNQWYALHTKAKSETRVAHTLREAGLEVFLPELYTQQSSKIVKTPFFPCYLFMATNLHEVSPSIWRWTPGLRNIVTNGSEPICVSPTVIQLIKGKIEELNAKSNCSSATQVGFAPGDAVRITDGPLKEMVAIFEGPTKPSRRVYVLLQMLNQQRRIQLDAAQIEKVDDSNQQTHRRQRRTRGRGRPITH